MTALEKGQRKQEGSSAKSFDASPAVDDMVQQHGLPENLGGAKLAPESRSDGEALLREKKANESGIVRWLQLLAAVGIPFVLVYLALANLVNPQFAELRELVSSNRDAIAANASSIQRLEDKLDSSVARLDARIDSSIARLEDYIDSSIARLEDKLNSSIARLEDKIDSNIARLEDKLDSSVARLDARIDGSVARLEERINLIAELLILAVTNENITEGELRNLLNAGES